MCNMKQSSKIIAKIKELFAEQKMAADYTSTTNETIRCMGELAVGEKVVQVVGGEETTLPDGNYALDNGKSIVVEAGEIKEINEYPNIENKVDAGKVEMEEDYKNEIMTKLIDGTEVKIMSKGDALSVGDAVMVKSGEEFVKAPEGKHELEGGLTIYVDADGFINELETAETDKKTEEDESSLEEMKTMFEAIVSLKESVTTLSSTIEELKKENTELKGKVEKFSQAPSTSSVTEKQAKLTTVSNKWEKAKLLASLK